MLNWFAALVHISSLHEKTSRTFFGEYFPLIWSGAEDVIGKIIELIDLEFLRWGSEILDFLCDFKLRSRREG